MQTEKKRRLSALPSLSHQILHIEILALLAAHHILVISRPNADKNYVISVDKIVYCFYELIIRKGTISHRNIGCGKEIVFTETLISAQYRDCIYNSNF